jgi:nucleotide-binding universal stress UspA family protein
MTIRRVLVAVDDSPPALGAAQVALELATDWHVRLRLVTVATDHALGALLAPAVPDGGATERIDQAGRSVLRHLADTARSRGLDVDAVPLTGEPSRQILDEARSWQADLIVMGRSDRRGPSSPYLGSVTAHVLEFAECPVLVVPRAPTADPEE